MILPFVLTILIVGIVTAGITIKFDRFFAILLLMFLFKYTIFDAINVFLWIIMLGALMILLNNKVKIVELPKKMKLKLFLLNPAITLVFSFFGTLLFQESVQAGLIITLGVLAILYGLRLIFIHFKHEELNYISKNQNQAVAKICAFFGPVLSSFSIGLLGTSLKPLKMPFAIRVGKMNAKQVYFGNTVTTFFASVFAIMWHVILKRENPDFTFYQQMLLGAALWTGIHYLHEISNLFIKESWRKPFRIIIGIILALVSVKIFMLI